MVWALYAFVCASLCRFTVCPLSPLFPASTPCRCVRGVTTRRGPNAGPAGSFVGNGGALGTPSSGTLTNATGLPISTGVSGLGTNVASALGTNVGTAGSFVVNGGALGTPSSGTLTNATGLPLTTGVTGTLAITNGGTGQTTANSAFNALAPSQATNSGKYLTTNGTDTSWAAVTASVNLTNDISTATSVYPLFATATSGTISTVYTSNANLLYKPSIGELSANVHRSSNGINVNSQTISSNYTIASGDNGGSFGPVTVASGVTVTVSSGSVWTVV